LSWRVVSFGFVGLAAHLTAKTSKICKVWKSTHKKASAKWLSWASLLT